MGGSPTMNDIILRLMARVYRCPQTMSTTVVLNDPKTGEEFVFTYKDMFVKWGDTVSSLVGDSIKKLAEEWPADAR